jgi:hypothetical protein
MANILNQDFSDFLIALNEAKVDYILVGGYAVIYHGYNRTTGDMDVWVRPTKENFNKLKIAFQKFGLSLFDMTEEKFLKTELYDVFSFGVPPVCIEILTKVKGLDFEECFKSAIFQKFDDVDINIIDLIDLIKSKKSVGRYKDLDDIENLEKPIP